jgi:outer membrane murein-binding lipoprotein Lpp
MKRMLIIFAVALAASLAAGCARPAYVAKSDAGNAYIKGAVKQISETLYDNPADAAALPDTLGMFDTYTVVEYNRVGNIVGVNSFRGPDSVHFVREEFFYDPSGERLERAVEHDLARRGATTVLSGYDEEGKLTSETESNGLYRFDHRYDRRGYPKTVWTESPETGKDVLVARYFYDRKGRLKRLRGERRERYFYHPDGVIARIRGGRHSLDSYNDHGHLESMAVRIDRKDRKGRTFERFSVTLTAEYDYDPHGNWIRRVQFYKGEVQSVAVREIEYYEDR